MVFSIRPKKLTFGGRVTTQWYALFSIIIIKCISNSKNCGNLTVKMLKYICMSKRGESCG